MKLAPETLAYLDGRSFDDDYGFHLLTTDDPADAEYLDRITVLEQFVAGKNIVHVGCVDHSAVQVERELARGTWLHERLMQVAEHCVGIDIDRDGIDFLSRVLKIADVFCCDLTSEDIPPAGDRPYDYLLLGEILEHVDDPVAFLKKLRARHFPQVVERLILTVPNALRERNYRASIKNIEVINSDHRYWFTPFTICKVLRRAGFIIDDIYLVRHKPLKKKKVFNIKARTRRHLQHNHPFLRDTIVVTAFSD